MRRWPPVIVAAALAGGCQGASAALDAGGPQAARIAALWSVFLTVCVAVLVLVVVALAVAVVRGRRHGGDPAPPAALDAAGERRAALVVGTAAGITVVVLLGLLVTSVVTGRELASLGTQDALSIELTGHQWWWEIRYPDPVPARQFMTANELHIPVGRPVRIALRSPDVIHSFWVPSLHGKRDLIPGQYTEIRLQADRAGVFEGQCAEYCGMQHAKMRLKVFAEEPGRFEAWMQGQRQSAPEPTTPAARRGRDVFVTGPCALCHTVQGTDAHGTVAPDLTHLASRTTLAAGALPNTTGHLAGWILDPQSVKPGTAMPASSFDVASFQALLAYLGSLR